MTLYDAICNKSSSMMVIVKEGKSKGILKMTIGELSSDRALCARQCVSQIIWCQSENAYYVEI